MPSNRKIYIFALIVGVINLCLIILLILPLIKSIENSSKDLTNQKQELKLSLEKKENSANLERIYRDSQKELEKIETIFVDPETPIDFIGFLETTARDSQVEIKKSLTSDKTQETDFGPALSFNISLDSSASNFMKFLEKLENGPYLIEIRDLNIKRSGEKPSGLISASLSLRVLTK